MLILSRAALLCLKPLLQSKAYPGASVSYCFGGNLGQENPNGLYSSSLHRKAKDWYSAGLGNNVT